MTPPTTTEQNAESGAEVAQISNPPTDAPKPKRSRERTGSGAALGRFSPRYWEPRLFRKTWTDDEGAEHTVAEWRARMQLGGDRREIGLASNDRQEASRRAAKLYAVARAKGWEEAIAEVLPEATARVRVDVPTVGDWIKGASEVFSGSPRSFAGYSASFRRIVADLEGIKDTTGRRYDYRAGGREKWLADIDEVKLSLVTPSRIEGWQARYVKSAGENPLALQRARRNANSFVRQARALFGRAIVKRIGIPAPNPMPFAGVELEPEGSTRYVATFDSRALMTAAQAELRNADPEAWKSFLLLLCAGLRRGELDALQWSQVDPKSGNVSIRTTPFFAPKTRTSERDVPLAPSVLGELDALRKEAGGLFVIESHHRPTPHTKDRRYRCREVFARLVDWLRKHGIDDDKPLHTLRKEFGSIVAEQSDLFSASRLLGHSNLDVTQRFYAEQRRRVVVNLMDSPALESRAARKITAGKS